MSSSPNKFSIDLFPTMSQLTLLLYIVISRSPCCTCAPSIDCHYCPLIAAASHSSFYLPPLNYYISFYVSSLIRPKWDLQTIMIVRGTCRFASCKFELATSTGGPTRRERKRKEWYIAAWQYVLKVRFEKGKEDDEGEMETSVIIKKGDNYDHGLQVFYLTDRVRILLGQTISPLKSNVEYIHGLHLRTGAYSF